MPIRTDFFACTVAELEGAPILATYNVHSLQDSSFCSFSCLAPGDRHICPSVKMHPYRDWVPDMRFGP